MPPIDANVRHPGRHKLAGVLISGSESQMGRRMTMNRNFTTLVIAALAIVAVVLGYQLYQERHKTGVEISIGDRGISIEKR
jgi:hypothetical protein